MSSRLLKYILPFFILLVGITVYYSDVFSYFISGDDIWQYLEAPKDWQTILHWFTFIQQYRPLPHLFFTIYHIMPFSIPLFHLISVVMTSINAFLFYVFLSRYVRIRTVLSLGISFFWAISHIIFYHIYALAGTADLLFMIFFWCAILFFLEYARKGKNYFLIVSWFSFCMAIFSKEIFISIPLLISAFTLLPLEKKGKKIKLYTLILYWFPTVLFYGVKIIFYQSNGSAYTYSLTGITLLNNIKHFSLWFLNYRHGWQMGMPLPVSKLYYFGITGNALLMTYLMIRAFHAKKLVVLCIFWIVAGLLPFFFLDRVLVYYLNISLFGVLILVAYGLQDVYKVRRNTALICLSLLFVLHVFISSTIKNQWKVYSFVAVANETSLNFYRTIIKPYKWGIDKDTLCLNNINGDVMWAVAEGRQLHMFTRKKLQILLPQQNAYASQCYHSRAGRFKVEGRSFIRE